MNKFACIVVWILTGIFLSVMVNKAINNRRENRKTIAEYEAAYQNYAKELFRYQDEVEKLKGDTNKVTVSHKQGHGSLTIPALTNKSEADYGDTDKVNTGGPITFHGGLIPPEIKAAAASGVICKFYSHNWTGTPSMVIAVPFLDLHGKVNTRRCRTCGKSESQDLTWK